MKQRRLRELVAHLVGEAVQQQVQAADRRLDPLLRLLCWQPAEGSAAGAPGEVTTLQDHDQRVCEQADKNKSKVVGGGGGGSTHRVKNEDVSVIQDVSCHHLEAGPKRFRVGCALQANFMFCSLAR